MKTFVALCGSNMAATRSRSELFIFHSSPVPLPHSCFIKACGGDLLICVGRPKRRARLG
jgi:hypothetical protein